MTQIVNGLHFRRFERDLASFVAALHGFVDFDLDNLTLDDLGLFSNSNTYSNSKENQLAFLAQKSNYLKFLSYTWTLIERRLKNPIFKKLNTLMQKNLPLKELKRLKKYEN
mgnify:CR=1 FL=1